jgi:hypothetical protein
MTRKKKASAASTLPSRQCRRSSCNRHFVPKRSSQVYCIGDCRVEDYQEKYYSPPKVAKQCPWCKEQFDTSAPKKTVYCPEKDCQREAAKDRMRKEREDYKRLKDEERERAGDQLQRV